MPDKVSFLYAQMSEKMAWTISQKIPIILYQK